MEFLSRESVSLMAARSLGEFKLHAIDRFKSVSSDYVRPVVLSLNVGLKPQGSTPALTLIRSSLNPHPDSPGEKSP